MALVKNKCQVITPVLMVKYNFFLIKDSRQDIRYEPLQFPIENNVITVNKTCVSVSWEMFDPLSSDNYQYKSYIKS